LQKFHIDDIRFTRVGYIGRFDCGEVLLRSPSGPSTGILSLFGVLMGIVRLSVPFPNTLTITSLLKTYF
jgi:hypothetical protein